MALDIGSVPQLFLDGRVIAATEGCHLQLHRPTRWTGNPVIRAEEPWENPERGDGVTHFGGSVLYDEEERLFKMWYRLSELAPTPRYRSEAGSRGEVNSIDGAVPYGGYRSAYAVSTDGVNWEKRDLGLVEFEGSTRNNVLPPAPGPTGFIRRPNLIVDYEEPDPARRYKMAYADELDGRWLLQKAYSPDGLRWQIAGTPGSVLGTQPPYYPLGVLMGWDPTHGRFVHIHRKVARGLRADVDGRTVRAEAGLAMSTSPDFEHWGETRDIALRHELDPAHWDVGHAGVITAVPYTEDLYVGFLDTASTYHAEDIPETDWASAETEHDEHRSELVMSRDGERWTRVAPHWAFLGRGWPQTWDSEFVVLSKPIVRDDDILIYYTGRNLTCGAQDIGHPLSGLMGQVIAGQRLGYAIGLASLRRDGFVSMDGYEPAGVLSSVPLRFEGERLLVNARAPRRPFGGDWPSETPFGELRVGIADGDGRPIPHYGLADCDVFAGDEIRHVVTWNGRPDVGRLSGEPVRLTFELRNASLYSFGFRGERARAGPINLLSPGSRGFPDR